MTKDDLVNFIAQDSGVAKGTISKVLTSLGSAVEAGLKRDQKVQIRGFGTFELRDTKGRTGRNPRTGEPVEIPASSRISFKASTVFRRAVVG